MSGLVGLASVAGYYRITADPNQLAHDLGLGDNPAVSTDIVRAARQLGLKATTRIGQSPRRLNTIPLPALLKLNDATYAVVAARQADGKLRIVRTATRMQTWETADELAPSWSGEMVLVTRRTGGAGIDPQKFNVQWFLPSIWRYRRPLGHVLIASLFIQLFALVTPLFFQLVIDKVLAHRGTSTLLVVLIGLIGIGFFEVLLQYLRTYALSHTTSRIDVELGARLFDHLLRLPLGYFEQRATGQTVARIRELETIRSFLTGQGLTSLIDLLFTFVFFAVLFSLSVTLSLVVLASLPLYALIAYLIRPMLMQRINERFDRGAASQQFLVESVAGMRTLKAAAVEPILRNEWEEKLAAYVRTSFQAVSLSSIGQGAIQYVSKVTTALVLFLGAYAVMNGEMTVGALVAFNMLMGQVTAPVLRLSQLWQDVQQVKVSVDRLGDILNVSAESRRMGLVSMPQIRGDIKISGVQFRYRPDAAPVLKGIDITVPAGQVLGIVGPSGSGKSTLTALIQRLYVPEQGQIMVDGVDIGHVDPASLRRQIGVVLQENLLFNRTIHDNIALGAPAAPRQIVLAAAQLAGADEFISRMPLGYDTMIEERGANLSGGQRQRIAIARALITQPRILILDEATSALDYESERIIQGKMRSIVHGRTVIVIAHRLAAVRQCHRIIAIKEGAIVEDGTHQELIAKPGGFYSEMWRMQTENLRG